MSLNWWQRLAVTAVPRDESVAVVAAALEEKQMGRRACIVEKEMASPQS